MSSLHQVLRALQDVDTESEASRGRVRALQAELADDGAVTRARGDADAARQEIDASTAALRDGEAALEQLSRTIAMLEKRLYDGSIHNAREAAGVEEELRHRRAERSTAEDAVLAAMERLDAAHVTASAAQDRLAAVEQAHAARVPALKAEGRAAMARVAALQQQRTALAAAAPPALLARYERLRSATRPAVVTLHGDGCGGCGVAVPTALRQKVVAGELVQCIACNRILVE